MKLKVDKNTVLGGAKNIMLVVVGTIVLSFGVAVFILPYSFVSGGVAGIAVVLDELIGGEFISVDLIVTALSWILFFLGLIFVGRNFAMKTLLSTILYPPLVSVFIRLVSPDVFGGYFYLQGYQNPEIAMLLSAIAGGAFIGAGCALTFIGGGSTGGTDIIAFILCRIFKRLKSSVAMFIVDATVVVLGVFVIRNILISLLGIAATAVTAIVIDKVFVGGQKTYIAQIISPKHEEIRLAILNDLNRGATVIDAVGAYSGEPKKVIMVSFTTNQYAKVLGIISATDKNAFVTVHLAHEINGEGFTIERGSKKDKNGKK